MSGIDERPEEESRVSRLTCIHCSSTEWELENTYGSVTRYSAEDDDGYTSEVVYLMSGTWCCQSCGKQAIPEQDDELNDRTLGY